MRLCGVMVEHHLRNHPSHSEERTGGFESDNFHTLTSIFHLFSEDPCAPLSLPLDDLFSNFPAVEDDTLATIACKSLGRVTDFRHSRNMYGNFERKVFTAYMKQQGSAARVEPGASEILLGDSVFALNNYEVIVPRLSKVSRTFILVAIASLEYGEPWTGSRRNQAASEVEFLNLDIRSLYRFCRVASKILKCLLVGKHCKSCEICTKQRLPLYFGW